jgi:hypothetical protein
VQKPELPQKKAEEKHHNAPILQEKMDKKKISYSKLHRFRS